jgi:hypothetical protein
MKKLITKIENSIIIDGDLVDDNVIIIDSKIKSDTISWDEFVNSLFSDGIFYKSQEEIDKLYNNYIGAVN